jgi:hypothetical protein
MGYLFQTSVDTPNSPFGLIVVNPTSLAPKVAYEYGPYATSPSPPYLHWAKIEPLAGHLEAIALYKQAYEFIMAVFVYRPCIAFPGP